LRSPGSCAAADATRRWSRRVSMAIEFSPTAATNFPNGGHYFSPLVATNLPTNRSTCFRCLGEWSDPLAGGRLREPVAVLPVGDQDVRMVKEPLGRSFSDCSSSARRPPDPEQQ
jgi:hypothetical protein